LVSTRISGWKRAPGVAGAFDGDPELASRQAAYVDHRFDRRDIMSHLSHPSARRYQAEVSIQ
jgi:hypothetical protein